MECWEGIMTKNNTGTCVLEIEERVGSRSSLDFRVNRPCWFPSPDLFLIKLQRGVGVFLVYS